MRIKSEELKEQTVQQVETITLLLVKLLAGLDLSLLTDADGNVYFRKNGTDIEVKVSKEELIEKYELQKEILKERE